MTPFNTQSEQCVHLVHLCERPEGEGDSRDWVGAARPGVAVGGGTSPGFQLFLNMWFL